MKQVIAVTGDSSVGPKSSQVEACSASFESPDHALT
uniref:Uncharacterized protein n=1 Tax=Nelumbo nucifera TaxID=4432 RepID=A0A822YPI7_NELNU|nr:TPA_asm: hypothetical protein HUJ06_011776 [Nelumbo nucifera]